MNKTVQIATFKNTEIVRQSNEFVDIPRNIEAQEMKLFLFIISKINTTDQNYQLENIIIRSHLTDLAKAIQITARSNISSEINRITKNLQKKILTLYTSDNTKHDIAFFSCVSFRVDGSIDFQIHPLLAPYLLQLKREFTSYRLSYIARLTSKYSIRLYELMCRYKNLGQASFLLSKLRTELSADTVFKQFKEFHRRVIIPAVKEINNKTDLQVSYITKTSKHNKVEAIIFTIKEKKPSKPKYMLHYSDQRSGMRSIGEILHSLKLSEIE